MRKTTNHTVLFRNKAQFKDFFNFCYPSLCAFASSKVVDQAIAEDFVQEAFIKLWENSGDFSSEEAAKSYLYTIIKNRCLNHLDHQKVIKKHQKYTQQESIVGPEISELIIEEETHLLIYNAINKLPQQCKNVLLLSINGLKNKEIAAELDISENTVKTQKKIAYKQLKIELKDIYLLVGILFGNMV